jgi:hypothetical protein
MSNSDRPLQEALAKVGEGDVAVQAPEWSNQDGWTLAARAGIALLLFGMVSTVLWNVSDKLPGEARQSAVYDAFQKRGMDASKAAANALEARRDASRELSASRAAAVAAQQSGSSPAVLREARRQRAEDRQQLDQRRRNYQHRVAERSAALGDVLTVRPSSDVDLIRALGVGALALIALLGAGALLAPRRSQLLSVKRSVPDAPPAVAGVVGIGAAGAGGPALAPVGAPAPSRSPGPGSGVAQDEPALTQGVLAAIALGAGLFGIQNLEGTAELLLNLALPVVPIIGAFFTRARVAPTRPRTATLGDR